MRPSVNPFDVNNFTVEMAVIGDPAAGVDYIGAVPVNARSMLSLLSFQLVTDANAANRYVEIQLHRGADVYVLGHAFHKHTQNITRTYVGSPGFFPLCVVADVCCPFGLPDVPLFLEGDTVRIIVVGKQVGDQLSAIRATWKIWPYEQ